jgi:histone H3/H4
MSAIGLSDLEIPRAVVLRKIKQAVDGKPIQKDAKTALSKATTVFISYLSAA